LRDLGVEIEDLGGGRLRVHGRGLHGFNEPAGPLDCGNSGTTMRLLAGLLAGQPFRTTMIGDASLSGRPMARVANPIREMGGFAEMTNGKPPLTVGGQPLRGMTYTLPMASAQVKSCVLLAGLYADAPTRVIEPTPSRDHTERLLGLVPEQRTGGALVWTIEPGHVIPARHYRVPTDVSAAAFFLVAGSIAEEGEVRMENVGLNPTRTGVIDVLQRMGANIRIKNERSIGAEPVGDLIVTPAPLRATRIAGDEIPRLIDEIPILCIAALFAEGTTDIRDAGELRVKETDRIDAMATNLRRLGAEVETFEDGLSISGGQSLRGAEVESYHDHRIAMSMAVAALRASGPTTIRGAEHAAVSFPAFWGELRRLAGSV
ncbi:MAG: 3-phosphoshikimate 1-carboxyvinyltransferase, partial [Bacteroidota bacterium]